MLRTTTLLLLGLSLGQIAAKHALRGAVSADPPQQVHLAYGEGATGTGMYISWVTNNDTSATTVQYGLSPNALTLSANGTSSTYLYTWDHHVSLAGLQPKTTYYYRCGSDAEGWSSVFSFTTAAPAGSEFPFNVLIVADMAALYNSNATFEDMASNTLKNATFLQLVGDSSYADDAFLHTPLSFGYEKTWNAFMQRMSDVGMHSLPWQTLPGNHEAGCHSPACILNGTLDKALGNFTAFRNRFRMPNAVAAAMWSSYDYGSVRFINIDTETDYPDAPGDQIFEPTGPFGNQVAWLTATLAQAAADRAAGKVSWIVVSGHRPVYSRANCDSEGKPKGAAAALQAFVEPLFAQYGVDLYLAGHVHASETSWPVFNTTNIVESYTNPPHTTYIVAGAAGCDEGLNSYADSPVTAWNRFSNGQDFATGFLYFKDEKSLTWTLRRSVDGATLDSFTITKA